MKWKQYWEEELLTQGADMYPAAELSLACEGLSLKKPTMEASNKRKYI
jgi:hypothetical protein